MGKSLIPSGKPSESPTDAVNPDIQPLPSKTEKAFGTLKKSIEEGNGVVKESSIVKFYLPLILRDKSIKRKGRYLTESVLATKRELQKSGVRVIEDVKEKLKYLDDKSEDVRKLRKLNVLILKLVKGLRKEKLKSLKPYSKEKLLSVYISFYEKFRENINRMQFLKNLGLMDEIKKIINEVSFDKENKDDTLIKLYSFYRRLEKFLNEAYHMHNKLSFEEILNIRDRKKFFLKIKKLTGFNELTAVEVLKDFFKIYITSYQLHKKLFENLKVNFTVINGNYPILHVRIITEEEKKLMEELLEKKRKQIKEEIKKLEEEQKEVEKLVEEELKKEIEPKKRKIRIVRTAEGKIVISKEKPFEHAGKKVDLRKEVKEIFKEALKRIENISVKKEEETILYIPDISEDILKHGENIRKLTEETKAELDISVFDRIKSELEETVKTVKEINGLIRKEKETLRIRRKPKF